MFNPFTEVIDESADIDLISQARNGNRDALEKLVLRHQAWIYNIAVRMLHHPQDAEDATQEILIKVLTRLASFECRSSFRTWLYRIVVNHVLNMKRGRVEHASLDFAFYGAALDNTPDLELADPKSASPDTDLLVTEAMISCTSGMLLCLDREQRLTFILGAIFGVSDTVAAELLEISPDNFRQRLARARRDLRNFMNDKCGLVNHANPCRCAKKTRAFIQAATLIRRTFCLFANESARCGKPHRRCMRPSTPWTENVRKSSADIRSIRRQTSGQCCGGWSNAPI